ncbi:MAG: sensor histidine kinase [Lysobacterales bacterium]
MGGRTWLRYLIGADQRRMAFALGNLLYLLFLFLPLLIAPMARPGWLAATLLSLPVFLLLNAWAWRSQGAAKLWAASGMGLLALALLPFNPAAHTYVIYAVVTLIASVPLRRALPLSALIYLAYLAWHLQLGYPLMIAGMTLLLLLTIGVGTAVAAAYERKDAALRLSQDEVRQLAQLAERERIGRDLHDLLGHTLSVIVLKAELAHRLFERDRDAARREIAEVEGVAREALGQVRRAVVGIRTAGLRAELVSARVALDALGIRLQPAVDPVGLDADQESALALVLREAVTNIVRHAGADQVRVELLRAGDEHVLRVHDNGRGWSGSAGQGIRGMRERMQALGGELRLSAEQGTVVEARIPAREPLSSSARSAPLPGR